LGQQLRTRLQPIRTVSEIELDFVVFTQDLFPFQAIAAEAQAMRRLGMTLQAIARALGVSKDGVEGSGTLSRGSLPTPTCRGWVRVPCSAPGWGSSYWPWARAARAGTVGHEAIDFASSVARGL
jgi:hypothetical protein